MIVLERMLCQQEFYDEVMQFGGLGKRREETEIEEEACP